MVRDRPVLRETAILHLSEVTGRHGSGPDHRIQTEANPTLERIWPKIGCGFARDVGRQSPTCRPANENSFGV